MYQTTHKWKYENDKYIGSSKYVRNMVAECTMIRTDQCAMQYMFKNLSVTPDLAVLGSYDKNCITWSIGRRELNFFSKKLCRGE